MAETKFEFKDAVKDLHSYYGRKATDAVIDFWWDELGRYPINAVVSACRLWVRRNRNVPTVEEFEAALNEVLKGTNFNNGYRPNSDIDYHWGQIKAMLEAKDGDRIAAKMKDLRESNLGVWNACYWRIQDWVRDYVGGWETRLPRFLWTLFSDRMHPYAYGTDDIPKMVKALPKNRLAPPAANRESNVAVMPDLSGVAVMPGTGRS